MSDLFGNHIVGFSTQWLICNHNYAILTFINSFKTFLWDIGKQYSPRYDAAERGVPSGAFLFAERNFIKKWNKILKSNLKPLKIKVDSPK